MNKTLAYGAHDADSDLAAMEVVRRNVEPNDIKIDILFCGICHTDLHIVRNDWGSAIYPVVPGHEIVGHVSEVGTDVSRYKVGDLVAVGCMVDSCRTCGACQNHLEQYCERGMLPTYNAPDPKHGNEITYGGYSENIVVDEQYVFSVPDNLPAGAVAPLLCAGITAYSPLRHWNVGKGDVVGVIGLGGLGHVGVKFAAALGANVVMITTSADKANDARSLGADEILISTDGAAMEKAAGRFDFLLNTIPVDHDINPYVSLLNLDGTMVLVGAITPLSEGLSCVNLMLGRRRIAGSLIGGIKETQEMLDFCGQHNISADIELVDVSRINEAYERMAKNDVKYRFVIDMASINAPQQTHYRD